MYDLINNLIDSFKSVIPISIVVLIVSLIIKLPITTIISFVISSFLLIIGILIYVVSPIDLFPGPIDDMLVIVLGIAAQKGISRRDRYVHDEREYY